MADNTIKITEKKDPPRIKEEFSVLKITIRPSDPNANWKIAPAAQKPAELKFAKPLVENIEGPFNENNELVDEMEVDKTYVFKATKFKESTFTPIKHIWFAEQIDNGEIIDLEYKKGKNPYLDENNNVCYKYNYKKYANTKIYAYVWKPEKEACINIPLIIPRVIITNEVTGYTIQALKGVEATFYDPAVIVPTYKVKVVLKKEDEEESKFSFDVTRDAWYSRGKNENNAHVLLHRAFVPAKRDQNLYDAMWIPNYPSRLSGLDAFIFRRFGERKIPAKPLATQTRLDGTPITSPRKNPNFATDVMIHIGGTYEIRGFDHLGGSYGCFAFIQKEDIYSTPAKAKQASIDDDYDDNTTNSDWLKVSDKIIKLWKKNKKMHILLENRDESKNYFPTEILKE